MACNMIPICEVCGEEFNLTAIPLILKCNHSFCRSCISQLKQMELCCTKCQQHISTGLNDLPVNMSLLLVARANTVKNYVLELKSPDLPMHISKLYSLLSKQIEDSSQNIETGDSNVQIHKTESKVKKGNIGNNETNTSVQNDPVNYPLLNIEESSDFFKSIYNKVKSGESIYTCCWISSKRRFGKLSILENMILFHCFDLTSIPQNSSIIIFSRIKAHLYFKKFYAFIKLNSKEQSSELAIIDIIKNRSKGLINQFLHYCTGENGQSYKNFVQVGKLNNEGLCCKSEGVCKFVHVIAEPGIPIYDREFEGDYEDNMSENKVPIVPYDTVFLEHFFMKGWFSLVSSVPKPEESDLIGRVISPVHLLDFLYSNNVSDVKILDCGLAVKV